MAGAAGSPTPLPCNSPAASTPSTTTNPQCAPGAAKTPSGQPCP
jgi:hypothetical protein